MANKTVYDPEERTWKKISDSTPNKEEGNKEKGNKKTGGTDDDSGLSESSSSKKSTTGKSTKKANQKTLRTLTGNLSYVPNENTIKIKPRSTIELKGLGKYLSGKYYVESKEISIGSSGVSMSLSVLKTNFRKSLKIVAKYPDEKSKLKAFESTYKKNLEKYKKSHNGATPKSHVVGKKETLYTISKKYFNSTRYANQLAKINGSIPKKKWTKLPVGYKLVIAKK